jgi:hypothetical protein
MVRRAVTRAHAAGDVAVADELVASEWAALVRHGQAETLRGWRFTDAEIEDDVPMAIATAWIAALDFVEDARPLHQAPSLNLDATRLYPGSTTEARATGFSRRLGVRTPGAFVRSPRGRRAAFVTD